MNRLGMMLLACALVTVSHRSWADAPKTNEVLRVILELSDGSRVVGTPGIATVPVQTPYAKMTVPLRQILAIKLNVDHEAAVIETRNGDTVKGVVSLSPLELTTVFGSVKIGIEQLLRISVLQKGRLAAAIDQGQTFQVGFDILDAPIGSIRPGSVLTGVYTKSRESWEVWSPSHPSRPDYHYVYSPGGSDGSGPLDAAVRPEDGKINLWGVTFLFDERGTVFHPLSPAKAVGRLELLP